LASGSQQAGVSAGIVLSAEFRQVLRVIVLFPPARMTAKSR
jgi:hypothetical protein